MTEKSRQQYRKRLKKHRRAKRVWSIIATLLITCVIVLCVSFDLDTGTIGSSAPTLAKSFTDNSPIAEDIRDSRIANHYAYKAYLEELRLEEERLEQERLEQERIRLEQERLERERLERERLEQERLEQERLEQERLAREKLEHEQAVKTYIAALAEGTEQHSALDGIRFRRNKEAVGKVALTFDDGPFKEKTYEYMEIFDKYGVKATFFLQAKEVERYPEQAKALVEAGHDVGCHSYAHAQINKLSSAKVREDMDKCLAAFEGIVPELRLYRFPYGAYNTRVADIVKEYGMLSIMWSVDTMDWDTSDPEVLVKYVLDTARDGDVILMHEGKAVTYAALPAIIEGLQAKGFELVTVSELLYNDRDKEAAENTAPAVNE